MQLDGEFSVVKSHFNLPTYQRRLRHLQSIAVRNLHCPRDQDIDLSALTVYFTLHKDEKHKAFYTSEKISGSLNPTWQSFDLQRCDTNVDLTAKYVVVRVWWGYGQASKVKMEAHVHLSGLVFFSNKLQVPGVKHHKNTLLFGLFNNIFIHYDEKSPHTSQLEQWILDPLVPKQDNMPVAVRVDPTKMKPSYNTNSLSRIHTVQRAIRQTEVSVQRIHSKIEDRLLSSNESSDKLSQREVLLVKVRQLRQELLWQTQQKQTDQESLEKYQGEQDTRLNSVKEKRSQLQELSKEMEEKRTMHIQSREMLVKENAQVLFRRKQIISEMVHYIYPIKEDEKQNFLICNVKLPNAEDYHSQDELKVSVALGFTCHLTQMVSHFMDMPLRYPMVHRGSRSTIIDHIHSKLTEKDREFPLYGKGKEKFQYNYAVFLLNKNISQLRFYCGLGTNDLRQTLPNLKSLLEQRLGVRLSPSQEQRGGTSTLQSPQPTSIGGSQASRRSQAPSSNTSSFGRRDFVLETDSSLQSVTRSTSVNSTNLAEGSGVGNISGNNSSNATSRLGKSMSFPQTTEVLLKPLSLDCSINNSAHDNTGASLEHGQSISGFDNSQPRRPCSMDEDNLTAKGKTKESSQNKNVIVEEDETEDLFKPSDDNFFRVKTQPVSLAFNKLFSDSQNDNEAISSSFGKDIATNGIIPSSDILQDSAQRSFKLVKSSAVHSEPLSPKAESSSTIVSDTQNGCHTQADNSSSLHQTQKLDVSKREDADTHSFGYSASYDSEIDGS